MTSKIRTALSATALGLASFTLTSAAVSGLLATSTIAGFSLLAAYGVFEIACLSYAAPRPLPVRAPVVRAAPVVIVRRVPAVIEYPVLARPACRACAA